MTKTGIHRIILAISFLMIINGCAPGLATGPALLPTENQAWPVPIAVYPIKKGFSRHGGLNGCQLGLEVENIGLANEQVHQIVHRLGGRILVVESWFVGNRPYTRFEIAIPYEMWRTSLYEFTSLGTTVPMAPATDGQELPGNCPVYSNEICFTLLLQQRLPSRIPPGLMIGWDPAATFDHAFHVTSTMFIFVANALIWLMVVGGPPILIAWAIWRLFRHFRNKHSLTD